MLLIVGCFLMLMGCSFPTLILTKIEKLYKDLDATETYKKTDIFINSDGVIYKENNKFFENDEFKEATGGESEYVYTDFNKKETFDLDEELNRLIAYNEKSIEEIIESLEK